MSRLVDSLDGTGGAGADEASLKRALGERVAWMVDKERRQDEADGEDAQLAEQQDKETWLLSGHRLLGLRVALWHKSRLWVGRLVRYLAAGEDADEDPMLLYMDHDDGDGEDLTEQVSQPSPQPSPHPQSPTRTRPRTPTLAPRTLTVPPNPNP